MSKSIRRISSKRPESNAVGSTGSRNEPPEARKVAVKNDLTKLCEGVLSKEKSQVLREDLGNQVVPKNDMVQYKVTEFHQELAKRFYQMKEAVDGDCAIIDKLVEEEEGSKLKHLFMKGLSGTVLHVLVDWETYEDEAKTMDPFDFEKVKPLIRFLLRIHPELPKMTNRALKTPLYNVIESSKLDPALKKGIIDFFCSDVDIAKSRMSEEVFASSLESLAAMAPPNQEEGQDDGGCHAIHQSIAKDVEINEVLLQRLNHIAVPITKTQKEDCLCLELRDTSGKTILHIALTMPVTHTKDQWAKRIVKLQPNLLKERECLPGAEVSAGLTPLQYFTEQMKQWKEIEDKREDNWKPKAFLKPSEGEILTQSDAKKVLRDAGRLPSSRLDELATHLKRICLTNPDFDTATVKDIMYKRDDSECTFSNSSAAD